MNRKKNRYVLWIALFLYIPLGIIQVNVDYRRRLEDLEGRLLLMPGQVAGSLVLGGFRGLAADLLWLNIEDFWHKGQHYKMLPLFDSVAWLQPQYITVWAIGGWHMAYNIFATVGRNADTLKTQFDAQLQALPVEKQMEARPLAELAEEISMFRESFQGYHSDGMPESRMPKLFAQLDRYDARLEKMKEELKDLRPLVETVQGMAEVPREQLSWYNRGVDFLKRGVAYNRERYDLYFELGWTYYHKGMDYTNAARYLERAVRFPHPEYVDSVLAHAYELDGQVDKAIEQWEKQLDTGFRQIAERALRKIREEGAFNPRRRRMLGMDPD